MEEITIYDTKINVYHLQKHLTWPPGCYGDKRGNEEWGKVRAPEFYSLSITGIGQIYRHLQVGNIRTLQKDWGGGKNHNPENTVLDD